MGAHLDHEETIPRKLLYRGVVDRRQPAAGRRRLGRLGEERGIVLLRVVEVDAVGAQAVEHLRLDLGSTGELDVGHELIATQRPQLGYLLGHQLPQVDPALWHHFR